MSLYPSLEKSPKSHIDAVSALPSHSVMMLGELPVYENEAPIGEPVPIGLPVFENAGPMGLPVFENAGPMGLPVFEMRDPSDYLLPIKTI